MGTFSMLKSMKNSNRFRWETFCINFFRVRWDSFADWPVYYDLFRLLIHYLCLLALWWNVRECQSCRSLEIIQTAISPCWL